MILLLLRYFALISVVLLVLLLVWYVQRLSTRFAEKRREKKKQKEKHGELPSDAGVRDLVAQGRIQQAVDLYRQFTGVDEFSARAVIDDMVREVRLSDSVDSEIRRLLKSQNKAGAIQSYQDATGADLAEALEYVERQQEKLR